MSSILKSGVQETRTLAPGLLFMDRWEGLKEWHQKHQELLQVRVEHGEDTPLDSMTARKALLEHKLLEIQSDELKGLHPPLKDLSVISERDEDSLPKDDEAELLQTNSGDHSQKCGSSSVALSTKKIDLSSDLAAEALTGNGWSESQHLNKTDKSIKTMKKPFLRRGQGLLRYNLHPEDVLSPYRDKYCATSRHSNLKKKKSPALNNLKTSLSSNAVVVGKEGGGRANRATLSRLSAPMQRLTLSMPSRCNGSASQGTWSQVLGSDLNSAPQNLNGNSNVNKILTVSKEPESVTLEEKPNRISFQRRTESPSGEQQQIKTPRSPEEDQESLAAYLDLEQHVENASFCSTSSKVERLVARSSQSSNHPSNPDTITQLKSSPLKTGRAPRKNRAADGFALWTNFDVENLLRARSRQLINRRPIKSAPFTIVDQSNKPNPCSTSPMDSGGCSNNIDSLLDQVGQARKPHLMKTMSSIDLDSSLVRNGLAVSTLEVQNNKDLGARNGTSDSSTESDSDDSITSLNGDINEKAFQSNIKVINPLRHVSIVDDRDNRAGDVYLDPVTVEGINKQIETHLSDLRREIECLQSAKCRSQKHVSGLEKKVQELEQRLLLEARSSAKRIEDEKQAAEKKRFEEQARFQKEKQALLKTIRDQRKNLPDPVSQQELLRLKQEVASGEERWRVDRAKSRGLESNLRIQITNLKRENEKLKDENSKLRREKETAMNAAKAKAASNTRVINSIAQQLCKTKPKCSNLSAENPSPGYQKLSQKETTSSGPQQSAYNLMSLSGSRSEETSKHVATIGTFPRLSSSSNEWASEDELDLGKETSDDEEVSKTSIGTNVPKEFECKSNPEVGNPLKETNCRNIELDTELGEYSLQEAQAKYESLFGKNPVCSSSSSFEHSKSIPLSEAASESQVSPNNNSKPESFVKTLHYSDGKVEKLKQNGTRVVTHPDGTWERHSASGSVMIVPASGWPIHISYFNGDKLEKMENGTVRYFYSKTNVWQTTFPDGHEESLYPSGQVERREPDGSTKVIFPSSCPNEVNNSTAIYKELCIEKDANGDTVILLPNGERELHTKEYMRKDFSDGTIKFVYKNGSQETRYPSGRIRIKDPQGILIKDSALLAS